MAHNARGFYMPQHAARSILSMQANSFWILREGDAADLQTVAHGGIGSDEWEEACDRMIGEMEWERVPSGERMRLEWGPSGDLLAVAQGGEEEDQEEEDTAALIAEAMEEKEQDGGGNGYEAEDNLKEEGRQVIREAWEHAKRTQPKDVGARRQAANDALDQYVKGTLNRCSKVSEEQRARVESDLSDYAADLQEEG